MSESFISEAELLELQPVYDDGKETIRTYKATPEIELRRRDQYSQAFVTVEEFTPVKIELADRLEQITSANGRVEQVNTGTFEVEGSIGIQRDDRFTLDGEPCVVGLVEPERNIFGYRIVHFRILGGR